MRCAAIVTASILLVGWLIFQILGYAIIIDRTGRLISATIVADDGAKQGFNKLPGNLYFAIPRVEGEIALRCRDGSHEQGGYVTSHMHAWYELKAGSGCRI